MAWADKRPFGAPSSIRTCLVLIALLLGTPRALTAQSGATSPSISGIVRDSTGLILPGATVDLWESQDRAPVASTVSAEDGTFVFLNLRPGRYRAHVTFPGFKPSDQPVTIDAYPALALVV